METRRLNNSLKGAKKACADCERSLPVEEFAVGSQLAARCALCRRINWKAKMMARERIKQGNRDDR